VGGEGTLNHEAEGKKHDQDKRIQLADCHSISFVSCFDVAIIAAVPFFLVTSRSILVVERSAA
jgi:hypothetical protein